MPSLLRLPRLNPTLVPTVPVEVDWSHPLARGLRHQWLLGSDLQDLCGTAAGAFNGSGQEFKAGPRGPMLSLNGAGSVTIPPTPGFDTSSCSISVWVQPSNLVGRFGLFDMNAGNATLLECGNGQGTDGVYLDTGSWWAITPDYAIKTGVVQHVAMVIGSDDPTAVYGLLLYVDGTNKWDHGDQRSIRGGLSTSSMYIGSRNGIQMFQGLIGNASLYDRPLSPNDIRWLAAEPFAMLRPIQPRRTWSVPSGPTRTRPRVMLLS